MSKAAKNGFIETMLSPSDWLIVEKKYVPAETPKYEGIFTLANGFMGTRGAYEEAVPGAYPATYIAGVFNATVTYNEELASAPNWLPINVRVNGELMSAATGTVLSCRRWLDMRNGLLLRRMRWRDSAGRITRFETLRLVHLSKKHRALIQGVIVPENHDARIEIASGIDGPVPRPTRSPIVSVQHLKPITTEPIAAGGVYLEGTTFHSKITVGVASHLTVDGEACRHVDILPDRVAERVVANVGRGEVLSFAKHVSVVTSRQTQNVKRAALAELRAMKRAGARAVVETHCAAWHDAWEDAGVEITGDRESQIAVRFNIFHLVGLANEHDGNVSLAARGLHGDGYRGSVFWDTEIFMLPFYIYTNPRAAKALLMYRVHRLGGAMKNARTNGYHGAQFPWQSGSEGVEITPSWWRDPITLKGQRIRSGELQHHITSDVVYAFDHYVRAAGDARFLTEHVAEVFIETARFWASRVKLHPRTKRYVIECVIGPDEAHEEVDNNRYTNRMAAWNIERALKAVDALEHGAPREWKQLNRRLRISDKELAQWRRIIERMWYPPVSARGVLEQHDGYFKLRKVRFAYDENDMPIVTSKLWRTEGGTQILKQADIVLLQFILADEFDLKSKRANYAYYAPRTTHRSSLSPSTYAIMGAEVGDMREAWRNFLRGAFMDLNDHQNAAHQGIHTAALGGTWMSVVNGFGGMRLGGDGTLRFAPRLPEQWRRLRFRVQYRRAQLRLTCTGRQVLVEHLGGGRGRVRVTVYGQEVVLRPGEQRRVRVPATV